MSPLQQVEKKRRKLAKGPAIKIIKIPAAIIPPYIYGQPKWFPMLCNGATYSTAHPKTTGNPIPVNGVRFNWSKVATPHMKISIETRYVIWAAVKWSAPPINSGTKISPEYMANKCWNPKTKFFNTERSLFAVSKSHDPLFGFIDYYNYLSIKKTGVSN